MVYGGRQGLIDDPSVSDIELSEPCLEHGKRQLCGILQKTTVWNMGEDSCLERERRKLFGTWEEEDV